MSSNDLRATLAANLRRMIERETAPGSRPSVRAWALKRELDVRLINRLVKGEHAVTLDVLDRIAAELGLQAWQLLFPDLDPASPPDAPISEEDRDMLRKLRRLLGD